MRNIEKYNKARQAIVAVNAARVICIGAIIWQVLHGDFLAALVFVGVIWLFGFALPETRKEDD